MLFELQGSLIIDDSKPTVVFFDKGDQTEYTHIYGAARVIKEAIQDTHNIITIGVGCKLKDNYYEVRRQETSTLLRKSDGLDYREKNFETLDGWLTESFKDMPDIDYIVLGTDDFFRLPLTRYASRKTHFDLNELENEFFDYVGNDPKILADIDYVNEYVVNGYDRLVSPFAFSTQDYNLFMRCIDFFNRKGKLKKEVIGFSIDPAIYTPFFDKKGIPSTFYYFAEDKRGTRNFEQLDIAQLQHIIYDNKFNKNHFDDWDDEPIKKTHNMFFAGTIFQDKGHRKFIWQEFLKDVNTEDCSYYIPLRRNGINKEKGKKMERYESLLKDHENFVDLYEDVIKHQHFKGSLVPNELNEKTQRYKYGMVFRCVSIEDSLNFRPVLYAYKDILPLLDYRYDPDYLQIPKEIQDKLVVKSADDIEERISYFNRNETERLELLEDLKDHFRVYDYVNQPEKCVQRIVDNIFK